MEIAIMNIVAELAPIPWIKPAFSILTSIIQLCQNVTTNRESACQLRDRCIMLLKALRDSGNATPPRMTEELDTTKETLVLIQEKMNTWANLPRLKAFLKQGSITKDFQSCNQAITDCFTKFTLISNLEIHKWQIDFDQRQERDHHEVISKLQDPQNASDTTQEVMSCSDSEVAQCIGIIRELLSKMQDNIPEADGEDQDSLRANLYKLLSKCHELLPNPYLKRGVLKFTTERRVAISGGMDVYEGKYLEKERVLIKIVRETSNDDNLNTTRTRRFLREADIWRKVYSVDKGQHLVPFYGFSDIGGRGMSMISPLQKNGTAIDYVRRNQTVDHRQLIRGIAEGIRVLHTMDPPIVHGSIQGINIFMSDELKPRLANFGVSRLVEDISGAPYTESNAPSDIFRWQAPEVSDNSGGGRLSLRSDVYSFAMTILELMTHKQPFSEHKRSVYVIINAFNGLRPSRPSEPDVIDRGLGGELWSLISRGWAINASERPTIQEMLDEL